MSLTAEIAATQTRFSDHKPRASEPSKPVTDARPKLRRGSIQQGRALEKLGHAVEYLVDSRMFLVDETDPANNRDALQILMRCSREVFSECPEVVTLWSRVDRLCRRSLARVRAERLPPVVR